MKIVLLLRSFVLSADRDALNLAYDYHFYWQGEEYHHIYRGFMDRIWSRGKIPDQDGVWLLNELNGLKVNFNDVKVFDVGSWRGWAYAIRHRVFRFPALIVDGSKAQGKAACLTMLSRMKTEREIS